MSEQSSDKNEIEQAIRWLESDAKHSDEQMLFGHAEQARKIIAMLRSIPSAEPQRTAHSMSEYRRVTAQGGNIAPPSTPSHARHICGGEERAWSQAECTLCGDGIPFSNELYCEPHIRAFMETYGPEKGSKAAAHFDRALRDMLAKCRAEGDRIASARGED